MLTRKSGKPFPAQTEREGYRVQKHRKSARGTPKKGGTEGRIIPKLRAVPSADTINIYICTGKPDKDMATKDSIIGHASALVAYAIFGFNIIVCKDLTSGNLIPPLGIFTLRSLVAGALFWLLSAFMPKEKIERKDYIRICAASMLGFLTCQHSHTRYPYAYWSDTS